MDAFRSERARSERIVEEAGLSRMYGGIHYRFDVEAGRDIGRGAAALALAGSLEEPAMERNYPTAGTMAESRMS